MNYSRIVVGWMVAIIASSTPVPAATEETKPPPQLIVSLTDGSRLVGTTTHLNLPFRSDVLGTLTISFDKLRTIKFSANHKSASVSLQNGDKMQGSIDVVALTLQTLFGQVTVPLEKTVTIEIRNGNSHWVEWEILPFQEDSNWPGARGEPAVIQDNDILLQGRPVRSKTSYPLPVTLECEAELEARTAHDGGVWLFVSDEHDPRTLEPQHSVLVGFGYGDRFRREWTGSLAVSKIDGDSHWSTVWGPAPCPFEAGKTYKLVWSVRADGMKLTIDDQTFDMPNVTIPWEKVQIRLDGWQPTNRWHVRNITVR